MGFKEVIQKIGGKGNKSREMISDMSEQIRMERIAQERQLSPNERELNRLANEDREEAIKERLDFAREKRQRDIDFGHNPIDAENIVAKKSWEVLKEPNQFSKKSDMFSNKSSILHSNKDLLKSNNRLLEGSDRLLKGGGMYKI